MEKSVLDALTVLEAVKAADAFERTFALPLWAYAVTLALVLATIVHFVTATVLRRAAGGSNGLASAWVISVPVLAILVIAVVSYGEDRRLGEPADFANTALELRATAPTACRTTLDAVSNGQVRYLTPEASTTVETQCGRSEFLQAANAPGSRLGAIASIDANGSDL